MSDPHIILIVEDQETDQFIAKRYLQKHWPSVKILTALDGREAIQILESDMQNLPDLILLDINMPRMNGLEFLEEWSNRHHLDIPVVVMLTSSEQISDKQSTQQFPVVKDYLLKPLTKETVASLDAVLGDAGQAKHPSQE